MIKNRSKRKKLIIIIIICSLLLIFFALHFFLLNSVNYRVLTSLSPHFYTYPIPDFNFKQLINKSSNKISSFENNIKKKIIVLWTPFFGQNDYIQSNFERSHCLTNNCIFTSNRSYLKESDGVIFHLRDLNIKDWPQYRSNNQRYILLHHESPPNTPNILHKIDGLINWTATYRYGSDIFLSPIFRHRTKPKPNFKFDVNYAQNKSRMVVWLASNCKTDSNRETYVSELKKTITVDVFGKCGEKVCLPKMSSQCLEKLSKEYRFILAFENSICRDYVTEKYFNAIDYDIIPVVFGGSDYHKIAPKKSLIDALNYSSPRRLARYLLYLSKNPNKYNEYFKWKKDYELTFDHYSCQICSKLNDPKEPVKVWHQMHSWWFDQSQCTTWKPSTYFR